ncbi:MAG TPA: GspH/FimT family protein [Gemmatimonadales bacterium]|jgi:prepilin-type N-terminal cleavage/methylation domain-containing protein|nr:GspH/FimT family protein [Gemmatimonadales bacterium]
MPPHPLPIRRGPAARRGFTLVELLIVLVVLGVLTAFAVPRIDPYHYRVEGSMRTLGSALQAAQREAVGAQHDVVVSFDTAGRRIRIHSDLDNDHVEDAGERVRTVGLDDAVVFGRPSGVPARGFGAAAVAFDAVGGRPAVVFHRNGSASESGGFYLTSARALADPSRAADTRAIQFERATGRSDWYRYQGAWQRGF